MAQRKGHPKAGGRKKGTPNKNNAEKLSANQKFFAGILTDEDEKKRWIAFLNGENANAIQWQAFRRYVEYKRGMPVQLVSGKGGGPIPVQIITNIHVPNE